ncbi:MAG: hypothetical protein J6M66_03435 [Lachnospiraceae bacterium]|nr:hypothetical protein [Lachnospiraceae bacterium]
MGKKRKSNVAQSRVKAEEHAGVQRAEDRTIVQRAEEHAAGQRVEHRIDVGIFALLWLSVSAISFCLFYRQCVESMLGNGLFPSDMRAYILRMQGIDSGYSFPYPVFFWISALLDLALRPEAAVALATTLLNGLGMILTKWALNQMAYGRLRRLFPDWKWLGGACISVLSISLFFLSMVYPPAGIYLPGIKYDYLGVFTPNPFHNATYMAARPFAILAFLWFVKLLDGYESIGSERNGKVGQGRGERRNEEDRRNREDRINGNGRSIGRGDYYLFALFLLLATMTKPSFTIVLVGAAGLIMLYRLCRSGFRNLRETVLLGLTFLPTFADLLYQYSGVFVPEEGAEGGIGFGFGRVWRLYCDNIPLAIGLAVGFPILVLLLNYREILTNTLYRFSWQIFGMGFAMAFFLYEKGFREPDFNFSWGYMYGIFFVFFGSVIVLLQKTAEKKKPLLLVLQWAAFGWHLVCGLFYFYGFLQGRMYY